MKEVYNNAIFWIDVDKIRANPYQPRREFDESRLRDLADSIRQYGVLQPLVVTRHEKELPDGGLTTEYELIAGERRWRASKLAGISQVPAMIRDGDETDKMKLEIAIIENLQREDLNPVDRAQAFHQLNQEFGLTHVEIAKKMGKSREYVSNSLRILALPEEMLQALVDRKIVEGHTRPILMLSDRPAEQMTLFKEIIAKRLTVRDAETIARRIAYDRVRKKERMVEPAIVEMEEAIAEKLGTRVKVEKNPVGEAGKITIDFFDRENMINILMELSHQQEQKKIAEAATEAVSAGVSPDAHLEDTGDSDPHKTDEDPDLYSVKNFSL